MTSEQGKPAGVPVEGAVFLVTGANRGIGRAIVEGALGLGAAKVYAGVRDLASAEKLVTSYAERVVPLRVDLEDPATIAAAAEAASDATVVVSNAGILNVASATDADAVEKLEREMQVNVYGPMRLAAAFAPVLAANGGGAFAQINSTSSLRAVARYATYCASKAASYSIAQSLRIDLARQSTLVVSVHPGPIATDMADQIDLENTEPPRVVSDALFAALEAGEFLAFPDRFAQDLAETYRPFADAVVLKQEV